MKRYYVATVLAFTAEGQDMRMLTIEDQHPYAAAAKLGVMVLFYRPVSAVEFTEACEALQEGSQPAESPPGQ